MAHEREPFLERWSRLKRERAAAPQTQAAAPPPGATARGEPAASEPPPLPPIESLTPESDFSAFMHPKVPELLRRAALKKLFQDPRYNVVDRFEAYWEDYTQAEPVPPELLEKLDQARRHVFGDSAGGDAPAAESAAKESAGEGDAAGALAARSESASAAEAQQPAVPDPQEPDGARTQDA